MPISPESIEGCGDERSQELFTIASIFPDELTLHNPFSATVTLPVAPLAPLATEFMPGNELVRLSHLPPVQLKFNLPETYPACAPPDVTIKIEPPWLPDDKLRELREEILNLWEETGRMPVIFAAIDHVQQCAEQAFDLGGEFKLSEELRKPLVIFDKQTKLEVFNRESYDCQFCLEPKKGAQCHRIRSCNHVFCRPCLIDYFTTLIKEGDVSAIRCIDPKCGKKSAKTPPTSSAGKDGKGDELASLPPTIPPDELEDIGIPRELVTRYIVLKKKKALEKDPNTIYCPRKWCQAPAKLSVKNLEEAMKNSGNGYWLPDFGTVPPAPSADPTQTQAATPSSSPTNRELEDNSRTQRIEKLQVCSACTLAFCRVCYASWHGEYQICRAPDAELTEEERANEEYLRSNTTPCPTCKSPVLKSSGCNHMICTCGTHFCFLCSAFLPEGNPYTHFNTRGMECYQRLWEGEEGDEENLQRIHEQPQEQVPVVIPQPERVQALPIPMRLGLRVPDGRLVEEVPIEELFQIVFEDSDDGDWGGLSDLESDSDAEHGVEIDDVPDEPAAAARGRGRGRGARGARGGRPRGGGRGGPNGTGGGRGRARRPRLTV